MESITFFAPQLYNSANITIVFILCVIAYFNYNHMDNGTMLYSNSNSMPLPQIYMMIFTVVIGLRPIVGKFTDMRAYSCSFEQIINEPSISYAIEGSKEWIWTAYAYIVGNIGGIHLIFFTTTVGYVLFSYLAICRFFKYRRDVALLFLFGFFSFFSYATNTIRAGLAMAIVLLALSYLIRLDKHNLQVLIPGGILCFIAFGIHRSSLLPIGSLFLAMTILRNCKLNMTLWLLCVIFSLIIGSGLQETVMNLVMSSDFQDDRVTQYLGEEAGNRFLRTGFRWDFILYSSLPLLVGLYVLYRTNKTNRSYLLLLNTYIIANMFWVLVNRASYSDRFAYLSWFLYPIIMAYPFLKIKIQPYQGALMGKLLLAVSGFTLLMNFAYYD